MQEIFIVDIYPFLQNIDERFDSITIKFHNYLLLNNIDIFASNNYTIYLFTKNNPLKEQLLNYDIHFDENFESFGDILNTISNSHDKNKIFLFSNCIGLSCEELNKLYDLLNYEENLFILGKAGNYVTLFLSNCFNTEVFKDISVLPILYDVVIQNLNLTNIKIEVFNNLLHFYDNNDINNLYQFLTNKENKKYCPDHIYEHFTNLFIELKEMQT